MNDSNDLSEQLVQLFVSILLTHSVKNTHKWTLRMSVICTFEDDLENLIVMTLIIGPIGNLAITNNILNTKFLLEGDDCSA